MNKNLRVMKDIACLSSGTMSSLTKKSKYDELDKIQCDFIEFVSKLEQKVNNWQEAWALYCEANKLVLFLAKNWEEQKEGLK